MKHSRLLRFTGRGLLTLGVLVLLFVAYQLWGTGLHEAKAQESLRAQFREELARTHQQTAPQPNTTIPNRPTATLPPQAAASQNIAPSIGDVVGEIQIPRIGVDKMIVQGVSLTQLDRAPGHYPQTPFPGQAGNAGIAGHRTTYGAPFLSINHLEPGDKIFITTLQGRFTYSVQWAKIVRPNEMWVLDTAPDNPNTLTLSACHPLENLSHRYIVRAVLQGKPAPHFAHQDQAMRAYAKKADNTIAGGLEKPSDPGAWPLTVLWALICALIWFATWKLSRAWRTRGTAGPPRWVRGALPYVLGVPLFLGALFITFENLSQLVPAGL